MPLYLDDKKTKLFKGDYKPMSVYLGDKKIAGYKYAEKSGEHIDFEGTYNDTASVTINGNSEQVVTEQGKNLFDINRYYSAYAIGDTLSYTQADFRTIHAILGDYGFDANTRYTFSCNYTITSTDLVQGNGISIVFLDENEAILSIKYLNTATNGTITGQTSLTNDVGTTVKYVRLSYGTTARDCTVSLSNIQLELGSTATPYEPFTPNSPSPDYPSPINSVEPFDLVSAGRNLWKNPKNKTLRGVTLTNNGDGSITLNGTCTASANFELYSQPLAEGVYTLYAGNTVASPDTSDRAAVQVYSPSTNSILQILANNSVGTKIAMTLQTATDYSFRVRIQTGVTYNNFILKAMLLKGDFTQSSLPNYQSYQGKTINFPHTLRSLPDGTRDYIEIDDKAKTAKLVQNIINFTLNGNESWFLGRPEFTNTVIFGLVLDKLDKLVIPANKDKLSSSHFVSRSSGVSSVDAEFVQLSGSRLFIRINKTRLATLDVAGFKAWLTVNFTTIQCQLETPIITELDYEAVKTFYDYTQIYTAGSEIPPLIEGKFRVME